MCLSVDIELSGIFVIYVVLPLPLRGRRMRRKFRVRLVFLALVFAFMFAATETVLCSKPIEADIDKNGVVDLRDLGALARTYGSHRGDGRWYPKTDLNGDGEVNLRDLAIIVRNYGITA